MVMAFRTLFWFLVPVSLAQQISSPSRTQSPFVSIPPPASDELRFGALVPEFETKDINGRIWRSEDLRGKYTVVYIWGSFLARVTDQLDRHARGSLHGMPDLPELQRFYDRVGASKSIQVLTFCQDYDYTHASDYMKQSGHSFPVIADWTLLKKLFPMWTTEYIVINPEGRASYPFRAWSFGRVLFEVEKVATGN